MYGECRGQRSLGADLERKWRRNAKTKDQGRQDIAVILVSWTSEEPREYVDNSGDNESIDRRVAEVMLQHRIVPWPVGTFGRISEST